jgi:haloalkane dehalogenase
VVAAYEAPFPAEEFKAGARIFPTLVPAHPTDPASFANRTAWLSLTRFSKPLLCAFSDADPITRGGCCCAGRAVCIPGACLAHTPHVPCKYGAFLEPLVRSPHPLVYSIMCETECHNLNSVHG